MTVATGATAVMQTCCCDCTVHAAGAAVVLGRTSTSSSERPAYTCPVLDNRGLPTAFKSGAGLLSPSTCTVSITQPGT